jgi:hypothetical protein
MKQVSESHKRLGFNIHMIVFILTMALLAIINVAVGPPWWVLWVLLGWGIGLLSHWWFVLGPGACRAGTG